MLDLPPTRSRQIAPRPMQFFVAVDQAAVPIKGTSIALDLKAMLTLLTLMDSEKSAASCIQN